MELKKEEVKLTIVRLQGQMDVWQNLYQALEQAERANEVKSDSVTSGN